MINERATANIARIITQNALLQKAHRYFPRLRRPTRFVRPEHLREVHFTPLNQLQSVGETRKLNGVSHRVGHRCTAGDKRRSAESFPKHSGRLAAHSRPSYYLKLRLNAPVYASMKYCSLRRIITVRI